MGKLCRESAAAPRQRRTPSWTYEGEEGKEETEREKLGGVEGRRIRERRTGEGQVVIHKDTGIGAVEVWSYC